MEQSLAFKKTEKNSKDSLFDLLHDTKQEDEHMNAYGVSQREVDKLLDEIVYRGGVTDGSFLYAWDKHDKDGKENGAAKFSAVAETQLYKEQINDNERKLFHYDTSLDMVIDQLSRDKKTHIELGPESGKKFIEYSDERDPRHINLCDKRYIGVDVSGVYVDMANRNVEKIGMVCESVPGDRFKHSIFDAAKDQIYYFFGGSIGNLDVGSVSGGYRNGGKKSIINLLKRMRSNQPFTSVPAVITYFEAPDADDKEAIEMLRATYGAKDSPYYDEAAHEKNADFILSGFEALGIPREHLQLKVEYDPGDENTPAAVKIGAEFTEPTEIAIYGNRVIKRKSDVIRAIKSQRFSKQMFESIAHTGGFTVKYQKSLNGIAVAVLQSNLGIHEKFKKERNRAYAGLIGLTLISGGLGTHNILHQREIKEQKEKMDTEFASKQRMFFYGTDHGYYELKTDAEKIAYIDRVTDDVLDNIAIRYNIPSDEKEVKKLIRAYIKDKEILWRFSNTADYSNNIFRIANECTQKYSDILIEKDIDMMPYDHLREYEEYFKDVIMRGATEVIQLGTLEELRMGSGLESKESYILDPANDRGIYPNIQLRCIKKGTKRILVEDRTIPVKDRTEFEIKRYLCERNDVESHSIRDGYLYVKTRKDFDYNYIEATSGSEIERKRIDPIIIAYDYFYQNRPIIPEICRRFGAMYWDTSKNRNRENDNTYRRTKDTIKGLIIRDMLETGMLDRLPINSGQLIAAYLQGFVKRNAKALQKEGLSLSPYPEYQTKYAESLDNTFDAQDKDVPQKISYEERDTYDFQYIGKFFTQTGNTYDVGEVTIGGKKYLYARNIDEDKDRYHTAEGMDITTINYYLLRGKEVVKAYREFQKINNVASDAIAKNTNMPSHKSTKLIHNKKPEVRSKGFNPGTFRK